MVTLGFSTSVAGSGVQSAQALYTRATSNLKESVGALTSALAATCGCDISVDTVKVAIERCDQKENRLTYGSRRRNTSSIDAPGVTGDCEGRKIC